MLWHSKLMAGLLAIWILLKVYFVSNNNVISFLNIYQYIKLRCVCKPLTNVTSTTRWSACLGNGVEKDMKCPTQFRSLQLFRFIFYVYM
mgnify:CR=1 FL=1